MATGVIAALIGALALGFVEALGNLYPARSTWRRLRRARGRLAVRLMRERFEHASTRKTPKILALVLAILVAVWIASASLLDKRWYEVVLDTLPYVVVAVALLRTPSSLGQIGKRMREYEMEVGEDPDAKLEDDFDGGDGGPTAIAL